MIENVIDVSHLLVGFNSAAHFFIYCLVRKNFRESAWNFLTCQPTQPRAAVTGAHSRQPTISTRGGSKYALFKRLKKTNK